MTQRVVVIIPAYNAAATLPAQLQALARQVDAPDFDVVVVDNRSTDETAAVAASMGARVVSAPSRRGPAYARNEGVRATEHDLILHCDADDIVDERWAHALLDLLDTHDLVGGHVSLDRVNPEEVISTLESPTERGLPTCMGRKYALSANMGYRRSLWVALGGFDETFELGHEEVDFWWRAALLGATCGFASSAIVFYRQRADLETLAKQRFNYGRSFAQLYSKHQEEEIPRVSAKMEARKIAAHLLGVHRVLKSETRRPWLMHTAWVAGRLSGDLRYRVRAPG